MSYYDSFGSQPIQDNSPSSFELNLSDSKKIILVSFSKSLHPDYLSMQDVLKLNDIETQSFFILLRTDDRRYLWKISPIISDLTYYFEHNEFPRCFLVKIRNANKNKIIDEIDAKFRKTTGNFISLNDTDEILSIVKKYI